MFIERANTKYFNKYSYTKSIYTNATTKLIITCPIHGDFNKTPNKHLLGQGCPECSKEGKYDTLKTFKEKANNIHNFKYDYSLVNYVTSTKKVKIVCIKHGEFNQEPRTHLQGHGCPKCAKITNPCRLTTLKQKFIAKSEEIHNFKYDYSEVNYIQSKVKVIIICPIHGKFKQEPRLHTIGQGCPLCNIPGGYSKHEWVSKCNKYRNSNPLVYIIRCYNDMEEFIKIGITFKTVSMRFSNYKKLPYSYEIIKEIKGSADFVYDKEKELHTSCISFKYKPLLSFGGKTECFNLEVLKFLIT